MEKQIEKMKNSTALVAWTTAMVVLSLAYVLEVVKGTRTIPYVAGVLAVGDVPLIVAIFLYRKNPQSKAFRYIMSISYLVFYLISLLGSPYAVTVIYITPIMAAVAVYGEFKLCASVSGTAVLMVIVRVVAAMAQGNVGAANITEYEVEFFGILLCGWFLASSVRKIQKFSEMRQGLIVENQKESEETAHEIQAASETVSGHVTELEDIIGNQVQSATEMSDAMTEMASAVNQVAEKLEYQSDVTRRIQKAVENIAGAADHMVGTSAQVRDLVETGGQKVATSKDASDKMKEVSEAVLGKVRDLEKEADDMQEIVTVIQSITENTDLLSLNASIEAARAGEAGKGFAVVADQIRKLAEDTQNSAVEITELLKQFHVISDDVQNSVKGMFHSMEQQSKDIDETYADFGNMQKRLLQLDEEAINIRSEMNRLKKDNQVIVDAINEMSAVSEEMAASAKSAEELSITNRKAGEETGHRIGKIAEEVQKLSANKD